MDAGRGGGAAGAALAQGGRGPAHALAQEVQLRAPHLAVADDLDAIDAGAVELEGPLDADAAGDPANGDGRRDARIAHPKDEPLEHLDALPVALDDLRRHLDGVTR